MPFIEPLIEFSVDVAIDTGRVVEAMAAKIGRVMISTGAYARQVMQTGMRYGSSVSPPGGFPFSHTGALRNSIQVVQKVGRFAGRVAVIAIIVNPIDDIAIVALAGVLGGRKTGSIPKLINDGGVLTVRNFSPVFLARRFRQSEDWTQRITRLTTGRSKGATTRYVYRPRPFIGLTLPKATSKLMQNMKNDELK